MKYSLMHYLLFTNMILINITFSICTLAYGLTLAQDLGVLYLNLIFTHLKKIKFYIFLEFLLTKIPNAL